MSLSPFQLCFEEKIAVIRIDQANEPVNTLKAEFADELEQLLEQIQQHPDTQGVVIISAKPNCFIAGADINMLDACQTAEQAEQLSRRGHAIFGKIAAFPIPVIAAIHGSCLGGGLELALACHGRIISDDDKTRLGLPEVQLGLLPGSGGTQRLHRLIGVSSALDLMLTGKSLRPKQALKLGLCHEVVPQSVLLRAAKQMASEGTPKPPKIPKGVLTLFLDKTPPGQTLLFSQARKKVLAKTAGNYPAPLRILELVQLSLKSTLEEGLAQEARIFGELVMTPESRQLRQIFFATTQMKKEYQDDAVPVDKAVVLGGGLMGGGIALVTAIQAGIPARIKDISEQGISHALKYSYDLLHRRVKRRIISASQSAQQMSRLSGTLDYAGCGNADIVLEAVFEDLPLKQKMVADVEERCSEQTIFASNTSSIPIHEIAAKAKRPGQIIGLHYFSPVEKMPLVEVIPHSGTSEETISRVVALARKQGKTPIVVKDAAGFYVNRILAPYLNQSVNSLLAGEPIEKLDQALVLFGFPVGPFTLLDEVGIDVAAKIAPILESRLGSRFTPPTVFEKLLADNRKGKKNGRGFYSYKRSIWQQGKRPVDKTIYKLLMVEPAGFADESKVALDCVLPMLNEAAHCLQDKIIDSPRDGDIGAIFGIGFPPFLGGPFRYMDTLGIEVVVKQLQVLVGQYGEAFEPCELLLQMAQEKRRFYPE